MIILFFIKNIVILRMNKIIIFAIILPLFCLKKEGFGNSGFRMKILVLYNPGVNY